MTQSARVPVDDDGLLAGQDPLRPLAARPGPHGGQRLAVALLPERDRAPSGAGGQVAQELGGPERPGGQRGGDRGGEEGAGQRDAAHLLEHDAHLEQAGARAALVLGDEETGPAEVDQRRPQGGRDAVASSASWRTSSGPHSRSSAPRATSCSASCSSSYVKSTASPTSCSAGAVAAAPPFPDTGVTVHGGRLPFPAWILPWHPRTRSSATSCGPGWTRTCRPSSKPSPSGTMRACRARRASSGGRSGSASCTRAGGPPSTGGPSTPRAGPSTPCSASSTPR